MELFCSVRRNYSPTKLHQQAGAPSHQSELISAPPGKGNKLPNNYCCLTGSKTRILAYCLLERVCINQNVITLHFVCKSFPQDGEAQRCITCFAMVIELNYHNPPRVLQSLFFRLNLSWGFKKKIFSFSIRIVIILKNNTYPWMKAGATTECAPSYNAVMQEWNIPFSYTLLDQPFLLIWWALWWIITKALFEVSVFNLSKRLIWNWPSFKWIKIITASNWFNFKPTQIICFTSNLWIWVRNISIFLQRVEGGATQRN